MYVCSTAVCIYLFCHEHIFFDISSGLSDLLHVMHNIVNLGNLVNLVMQAGSYLHVHIIYAS